MDTNNGYKQFRGKETCSRLSKALMGHPVSTETRLKIGKANTGRKLSQEHKLKISRSVKGKVPWNIGIKTPKKVIEKISLKLKGRKFSKETRKKMSLSRIEYRKRVPVSRETRNRMVLAWRERRKDPSKILSGERHPMAVLTKEQAIYIRKNIVKGKNGLYSHESIQRIANKLTISKGLVRSACSPNHWSNK